MVVRVCEHAKCWQLLQMRSPGQAWKLQILPISQSQQLLTKIQSVLKCNWSLISQLWINLQFRYNCLCFCSIIPTWYTARHIMYWNNLWCCMISNFNIPNKKESRLCINSNNCMTNISKQFYVFSSTALYYVESASYFSSLVCLPGSCMLLMGLQSNQITGFQHLYIKCFLYNAELNLGLHPTNERQRYFVTTSLIGW